MKVALVTNNYKPYSGGVVSAIDVLAQNLVLLGHQVYIITLDFEHLGHTYEHNIAIMRITCPVRFKYKTNHIAIPWLPNQAVLDLISAIKPDIIHAHHPFLLGIAAAKAGQKLDIPVVFTHHSQYEKFAHLVPLPQVVSINLIKTRLANYCKLVQGIVAPSQFIAQELAKYATHVPIRVIPSGILPLFLNSNLFIKPIKPVFELLTVSRFAREKNLYFLLDMFHELVNNSGPHGFFRARRGITTSGSGLSYRLALVGYGPELPKLKYYAYQQLNLSKQQVFFVEKPAKIELKQFYTQADLFVFASQAETQGLVLAEAMASGTPVVALAGPGQNELVINGQNGFLVQDRAQMVQAIKLIASKPKLHQAMQKHAFKTGRLFEPKRLCTQLVDFYQDLI